MLYFKSPYDSCLGFTIGQTKHCSEIYFLFNMCIQHFSYKILRKSCKNKDRNTVLIQSKEQIIVAVWTNYGSPTSTPDRF